MKHFIFKYNVISSLCFLYFGGHFSRCRRVINLSKFWRILQNKGSNTNLKKKCRISYQRHFTKKYVLRNVQKSVTFRSNHQRCSVKKVFLEISQNSQENTEVCFPYSTFFYGTPLDGKFWKWRIKKPVFKGLTCSYIYI